MMNRFQHSGFKVEYFPINCTMDWLPHTCLLPYYFYIAIFTTTHKTNNWLFLRSTSYFGIQRSCVLSRILHFFLYFYVCFTLTYLNFLLAIGFPLSDAHSSPLFNLAKNTSRSYSFTHFFLSSAYDWLIDLRNLLFHAGRSFLLLKQ